MKECELCGIDNPDEARFCMKCGKDLDQVRTTRDLPGTVPDSDTFTPLESDEYARLAPTRRIDKSPVGDVASYKEAAATSAAAMQAQQEIEQAELEKQDDEVVTWQQQQAQQRELKTQAPEIQQRGMTADFAAQRKFCQRCGIANPHDQRYCKNCGSALDGDPNGMADQSFEAPPSIAAPSGPVETTMLADVSPSSAYYGADEGDQGRPQRRTRGTRPSSAVGIRDWGIGAWIGLTAAALVLIAAIWLAFFGGFGMLFGSASSNIHKAGATMQKLPGFQLSISAAYDNSDQTQYPGGGHVLFDSPDKSAWETSRNAPGKTAVQGTLQIGAGTYVGSGGAWKLAEPGTAAGDVILMWKQVSSPESLPNETLNGHVCLHYKYRMDSTLVMTVLGLGKQDGVSDAVMEAWIDSTSFQVIRETAQIFGAQVDGARSHVTMVMDLVETGKTYGIKQPI